MSEIRTRFAPSPTGYLHIGSLRTVLYSYAYAKTQGGVFMLRVEDTDVKRFVPGCIESLIAEIEEFGLTPDPKPTDEQLSKIGTFPWYTDDWGKHLDELEGVKDEDYDDVYIQSQRIALYQKYALQLMRDGFAYPCFCTEERLKEQSRKAAKECKFSGYDGHCRQFPLEESMKRIQDGEKFVVRLNVPAYMGKMGKKEVYHDDRVLGKMTFPLSEVNDQVLIKSNGIATYHLAVVVDDYLMRITHPMRGWEWIPSTPKQVILYDALGWKMPRFTHLTAILDPEGGKLSKRKGSVMVKQFLDEGYLHEAILNFICLLGWSPGSDREMFTLDEFIKTFSIKGLTKSNPIFDREKLKWFNRQYMVKLTDEEFHSKAMKFYPDDVKEKCDLEYLSRILKSRIDYLGQIPEITKFLVEMPEYSLDLFLNEKMKSTLEITKVSIEKVIPKLEDLADWSEESIKSAMFGVVDDLGCKVGQVLWPLRIALSGQQFTPGGAVEIAVIIGKEETLKRLQTVLNKLI